MSEPDAALIDAITECLQFGRLRAPCTSCQPWAELVAQARREDEGEQE